MIFISIGGLNNDSSVIFVGEMSPNVSSDSVIYVGTTQAKREPNDVDNNGAVKEETNNNDDAELSQILNSFLTMNLNSPPIQSEFIQCNEYIVSKYISCFEINSNMIHFIAPFTDALDMPGSSTPNFADPLGYGHRFDRLYSMDYSFVPFGAAGFGNAIHGPFGYAPQPPANFGQYYTGFGAASFGPASFGAASFGAIRNNGNDLNDEPNSIYTTANEPSQLEETEQKYVLPSVKKENRD